MKFLLVSDDASGMGIALKIKEEGHEVALVIGDNVASKCGENLVQNVYDWNFVPDRNTIIVADCTGNGFVLDLLRAAGYKVIGGSALAERLENDREFSAEVAENCGLPSLRHWTFKDWEEAEEFVREFEGRLVFKPTGESSGNVPSYVAKDADDMLEAFRRFEPILHGSLEFQLQEFMEGEDVSSEGWFDGRHFVQPFNHTLECKHFMDGDVGPSGGCSGNIIWACDGCAICESLLPPIEEELARLDYGPGAIDVNSVIGEDGKPYFLEFTPRWGYDATPTMFYELLDMGIGDFLQSLLSPSPAMRLRDGFAAGIKLSLPPWPSDVKEPKSGVRVEGVKSFDHFFPYNLMVNKETDELETAGAFNLIGVATGYGATPSDAMDEAYKIIKKIHVPEMQYRSDLSSYFEKKLRKLRAAIEVTA